MESGPKSHCRRCGTCCRKGGPALHLEDQSLVTAGKIPLKDLITIRRGEPAFDNVAGTISPAGTDIIKIKIRPGGTAACVYLGLENNDCAIYTHRPLECRTLFCERPEALTALYRSNRLTREHLLANVAGLLDLVVDHQNRCDPARVAELAERLHRDPRDGAVAEQLMVLVRYDHHLRRGVLERGGLAPDILDVLFGRPLTHTLGLYRIRFVQKDGTTSVQPFVGGDGSQP